VSDTETGAKWWIRNVIVPIVAGGGLIALAVGYLKPSPTFCTSLDSEQEQYFAHYRYCRSRDPGTPHDPDFNKSLGRLQKLVPSLTNELNDLYNLCSLSGEHRERADKLHQSLQVSIQQVKRDRACPGV
jgi:hypothetical protein